MVASYTRVSGGVGGSQGWLKTGRKTTRPVAAVGGKENRRVEREIWEMGVCVFI